MNPFLFQNEFSKKWYLILLLSCFGFITQCQMDKQKGDSTKNFDPTIKIPFPDSIIKAEILDPYAYDDTLESIIEDSLFKFLEKAKLKAYKTKQFEEQITRDSLYLDTSQYQYLGMGLKLNAGNRSNYGLLTLKYFYFPYKNPHKGRPNLPGNKDEPEKFFIKPYLVRKHFSQQTISYLSKAIFNSYYYIAVDDFYNLSDSIKQKFKSIRETLKNQRKTIQRLSLTWDQVPGKYYYSETFDNVNKILFNSVKTGQITAYRTPFFNRFYNQEKLSLLLAGDTVTRVFKPLPVRMPNLAYDTRRVEALKPSVITDYLVLEKWKQDPENPFVFQPRIKAISPVFKPGPVAKNAYWIKWDTVKDNLGEEKTLALKRHLLFNLYDKMQDQAANWPIKVKWEWEYDR